jgi:DNA topoisomerase-1
MDVVVVESPAKAKTINRYLGDGYRVLASYGHVRDLPSKDGSVRPDENFAMTYIPDPRGAKHLSAIAKALRGAEHLYLATDPDREGEAIAWHVLEALTEQKAIEGVEVKRVAFNEITKRAVLDAIEHSRDLDMDLVNAQQARRALDYLVGFTLSPVLWRKLPGSRSAGRVQSVALRLICEREFEIEAFKPREYWSIDAEFATDDGIPVRARLSQLTGKTLSKFSLGDEAAATAAVTTARAAPSYAIATIEAKQSQRHPPPPFRTSTLQQEAAHKLRFAASHTMSIAQRLYEGIDIGSGTVGLISYMRTDGVQIAGEAIAGCRSVIDQEYGADYVPAQPRAYRTKAKNAQEAHEAVRPTDLRRLPKQMAQFLDADHARLYELIWNRVIASQMESARVESTAADIAASDGGATFRATGTTILFDGFLRLYKEGRDDQDGKADDRALPKLRADQPLGQRTIEAKQHFTEPPPRFTEATLVKRLEELGIGRPSTYASIIDVLRDRDYVRIEKTRFIPEDRGRLVTAFLTSFFRHYVEYDFTAVSRPSSTRSRPAGSRGPTSCTSSGPPLTPRSGRSANSGCAMSSTR